MVAIAVTYTGAALSFPVSAQARAGDETVEEGAISGDLVWVGKRALSVEFARTESTSEEMLLPLDGTTKIDGPKRLTELKRGDRVSVSYRQTFREQEDGTGTLVKTVATRIALLRSASEGARRSADEGVSP